MKTLKIFLPLIALTSLVFFSACKKTVVPPSYDPPPFVSTGTMTIGSETYDLSTWTQGPTTFSAQAKTLNVTLVKENVGTVSFYVQEISNSEITKSHTLAETGPNGGSVLVTINSTPNNGKFISGTLTVDKNEDIDDVLIVGDYRLLGGSYSFAGETTGGEQFSGSGTFKDAQTIFN